MTAKDMLPAPGLFRERAWIWLTSILLTTVGSLLLALLTPVGSHFVGIWSSPAANAAAFAALNDRLDAQPTAISDLAEGVKRAAGEDRVIRQTPGLSYVAEPVYQGGWCATWWRSARHFRSRLPADGVAALFTDATGIAMPGSPVNPGGPRRQISDTATRLRIELYLALTYDCAGREVYDRTDPVIYGMLRGPRPV